MNQKEVTKHFNQIAQDYDGYKQKNSYYYNNIKRHLLRRIPENSIVLDYGCGTGEILAHLSPRRGVGFDPSTKMIALAREKFKKDKKLRFTASEKEISLTNIDFIVMVDVIEHLPDPSFTFHTLERLMNKNTILYVFFVEPRWEPILSALEKMKLKMPEGPHTRISADEVIRIAGKNSLSQISYTVLFPFPITILSFRKS